MFNKLIMVAAALLALGSAGAANAKNPKPPPFTQCLLSDIGPPGASACQGWISGNLNGGSPADNAGSAVELNLLLGGITYTASNLNQLEDITATGATVNFATALFGDTVVSFHVGGAGGTGIGVGYQSTAFYEFNAGNLIGGLDTIAFNLGGLSNARLYKTGSYVPPGCTIDCGPPPCTHDCGTPGPGVPEPTSWALLILGFGGVGAVLRRRREDDGHIVGQWSSSVRARSNTASNI
jgi:hypothetical protein